MLTYYYSYLVFISLLTKTTLRLDDLGHFLRGQRNYLGILGVRSAGSSIWDPDSTWRFSRKYCDDLNQHIFFSFFINCVNIFSLFLCSHSFSCFLFPLHFFLLNRVITEINVVVFFAYALKKVKNCEQQKCPSKVIMRFCTVSFVVGNFVGYIFCTIFYCSSWTVLIHGKIIILTNENELSSDF